MSRNWRCWFRAHDDERVERVGIDTFPTSYPFLAFRYEPDPDGEFVGCRRCGRVALPGGTQEAK